MLEKEFNQEEFIEFNQKNKLEQIENQLKQENTMELVFGKDKLNVEYQILDLRDENEIIESQEKGDKTIILIQGFPASMRNMEELRKSLALGGKRVITLSLPGFGNSDNPPEKWLGKHLFDKQIEVVNKLLDGIIQKEKASGNQITTNKFTAIGPSMAAVTATKLAANHPEKIDDLILLHPAGLPVKQMELMMHSPRSSAGDNIAIKKKFKNDPEAQKKALDNLNKMRKDGAKNWRPNRVKQRFTEIKLLSEGRGGFLEDIKNFKGNIHLITGTEDKLFRPEQIEKIKQNCNNAKRVGSTIIQDTSHAGPCYAAEEYSEVIINQLDNWREEELKEKKQ